MLTIFNKAKKPRFLKVSLVMFDQCPVITSEKSKRVFTQYFTASVDSSISQWPQVLFHFWVFLIEFLVWWVCSSPIFQITHCYYTTPSLGGTLMPCSDLSFISSCSFNILLPGSGWRLESKPWTVSSPMTGQLRQLCFNRIIIMMVIFTWEIF